MNKQQVKPLYCAYCEGGTEHVLQAVKGDKEEYCCTWCGCKTSVHIASTAKAV